MELLAREREPHEESLGVIWGLRTAALVVVLEGCATNSQTGNNTGGSGGAGGTSHAVCAPVDDHNPCTDDVCENGSPVSKPAEAGSACATGGTVCDGLGACVACLAPAHCPGKDDACPTRSCTQAQCGFDFAAAGTALPVQTAGDCLQAVCDRNGNAASIPDDTSHTLQGPHPREQARAGDPRGDRAGDARGGEHGDEEGHHARHPRQGRHRADADMNHGTDGTAAACWDFGANVACM